MRNTILWNTDWSFQKKKDDALCAVTLPHTWNAQDGQDGNNDYYRGKCLYEKRFTKPAFSADEEVWLEFGGANLVAEVFVNDCLAARHEGGYATFRANITAALCEGENSVVVTVDNSYTPNVYPQKADFTFYGGIYRDVYMLIVPKAHFALGYYGGTGLKITPHLCGNAADIVVESDYEGVPDGTQVRVTIEGVGETVCTVQHQKAVCSLHMETVHVWHGVEDPYLYTATACLPNGDSVSARFGCRTISFDGDTGFSLNGKPYRLCGVSRHQDRRGAGNALTREMHEEDMRLIRELGANTIRLAHYQHDQYFYDLCDEAGMVVWAEIPYITEHMPNAQDNTLSQMTELVVQNYNHPSIVCWGLSNEITAAGGPSDAILKNHRALNDLCHKLDTTRPTTMAHAFMLEVENELVCLPDICGYNLYFGWYVGKKEDNDAWFDAFRTVYPHKAIALSEYGADATLCWQTGAPEKGDTTEQYQAVYHEHMLKLWSERPYLWAMHAWNMFDFAADGRNDEGESGVNHKGLVSFDRTVKKDAFFIYKAYLSKEPFVHVCGRRYEKRAESVTNVKVYSNQAVVTLFVDGTQFATQTGDKIFNFTVPITSRHTIEARSGACADAIHVCKVETPCKDYMLAKGDTTNWFDRADVHFVEGCFSIRDSMADLKRHPRAAALLEQLMARAKAGMGDVAKGITMPESVQRMMDAMPLESVIKQAGKAITPEMVVQLNAALNQIRKDEV